MAQHLRGLVHVHSAKMPAGRKALVRAGNERLDNMIIK
jgi:hypothetical protein